jgi:hypothetical protein
MDSRRARTGWWQALLAAAIALAVDVLYLMIIWGEGEGELTSGRVFFVAACVAGAAAMLVWGLTVDGRRQAVAFTGAAAMLAVWTFLGAFSIGLLLAPATVFAVLAATKVGSVSRREAVLAVFGAVAIVAAGLLLT